MRIVKPTPIAKLKVDMAGNITFTMIKPYAVEKQCIGKILDSINAHGFEIVAMKMVKLTREQAAKFYEVHKGRPFYEGLVEFMSSGPIVAAILKKKMQWKHIGN